ncbi:uncharacterized protein LOC108738803 [Agrilus planipennis]|uniref:Uncharacterized protein LOC108738803 n=1 Tax=Agrilus planipennis TaxID=224129 RepID=A0A1W4X6D5_AGRPL|nr:uncharacterized protein LOC108738803 [Agrilus planipennis]
MGLRLHVVPVLFLFVYFVSFVACEDGENVKENLLNVETVGRQLVEQGRTFVHHVVKRFMVLIPVIFFKLGIGFALLVLVTLLAANNGIIGFLLLVVGMSAVLARLQEARRVPFAPAVYAAAPPVAPIPAHVHWDRKDTMETPQLHTTGPTLPSYYGNTDVVYQKYYPSNQ